MRSHCVIARWAGACLAGILWMAATTALAEPIVRVVTFKVASPDRQPQVLEVTDAITRLFKTSKEFRGITFAFDPETRENIAVSVWGSRAGMEAVAKSEAFKTLFQKMQRLAEGGLVVKTYQAYEPKGQ